MILDTSIVIAAVERLDPHVLQALRELDNKHLTRRSIFVQAELQTGVKVANQADRAKRAESLRFYEQLSAWPTHQLHPGDLAEAFADVQHAAITKKRRIGQNDAWILAEAMLNEIPVLTADRQMYDTGQLLDKELTQFVRAST